MRGGASFVYCDQQTPPLTVITYSTVEMLTTRDAVIDAKARYWWKIAIFPQ